MYVSVNSAGKPQPVFQNHHYVGNGRVSHLGVGKTASVSEIDERKQRRMISNRESARRSRMKKQEHLDELQALVNRLRMEKRQMLNKLSMLTHHYHQLVLDSAQLGSQQAELSHRLVELHRVLATMRHVSGLPSSFCQIGGGMISQPPSSLIT